MANRFAIIDGNFNSTATWSTTAGGSGGASVPIAGDNAYANNHTVTITVSATCDLISNANSNGATAGGNFILSDGCTLTTTVTAGSANTGCVIFSAASATIVGNITGGSGTGAYGASNTRTGTLTIVGSVTGGSGALAHGSYNSAAGTLNIIGQVNSGTSGNTANGVGTGASTGIVNVTGPVVASGSNLPPAIGVSTSHTVNIIGDVTGGNGPGILTTTTCAITITGTVTASASNSAISSSSSSATILISGTIINAINGRQAIYCSRWRLGTMPVSAYIQDALDGVSTYVRFYTADNNLGQAAITDVRNGISYASGSLIGTMNVPSPAAVSLGALVDGTTGTAATTPQQIWDVLTSNIIISGSIGERLKNSATISAVGAQIAASIP